MPTTITPANTFDATTAITRPSPGERTGMETGASPLAPLLQRLADRDHALRLGTLGQMAGGDRMSVDPGGSSTVFAVRVSAIRSALIKDAVDGVWRGVSLAAQTLGLTATAGPLAALAADTWYYVTLAVESGVPRLYINVFGPDDSGVWETGSPETFRYIGCFRTDASGAPLPMRMHRGRYTYRMSSIGFGGYLSKTITTTAWTAYDFSTGLPPHARIAHLRLLAVDATNPPLVQVRTPGDTASVFVCQGSATGTPCLATYSVELDSGQDVEAQIANATANASEVDVVGFEE